MVAEFVSGSMGSGKTSELIRRVKIDEDLGKPVELYRPGADDRELSENSDNYTASRLGLKIRSTSVESPESILRNLEARPDEEETCGITEIHLFRNSGQFIDLARRYQKNTRKRIIMDGLLTTFAALPFPLGDSGKFVSDILPYAHHTEMIGKCFYRHENGKACERPARFSLRLLNGMPAPIDAPVISTGSENLKIVNYTGKKMLENYLGVCEDHHIVPQELSEWDSLLKKYNFPQPVMRKSPEGKSVLISFKEHLKEAKSKVPDLSNLPFAYVV